MVAPPTARFTLPGVYVEEAPVGARAITAAPTAVTAFIGHAQSGPLHQPVSLHHWSDFENQFGGFGDDSTLAPAVRLFFDNSGTHAIVVRLPPAVAGEPVWQHAAPTVQTPGEGLYALDAVAHVNLLCLLPPPGAADLPLDAWAHAAAYARQRGALLLVDAPAAWTSVADAVRGMGELRSAVGPAAMANAAVYGPRLRMALPGQPLTDTPPCGAVAGVIARNDAGRGVWKAPAGREAFLRGVASTAWSPNDLQLAELTAVAFNSVRSLPGSGTLVWGARTLAGHTATASEWKYVPVRRLALHIQQSVLGSAPWVVFEPNDETLWAQLRTCVTDFLTTLWRQGALQGQKPDQAFFVRCGRDTMTEDDITNGQVRLQLGFAPLKPAEFHLLGLALKACPTD